MRQITQSSKLAGVRYDVRGPILQEAERLEREGHRILKLNIGNPAPFGFEAPPEIVEALRRALPDAQGYSDSRGILPAREAVARHYTELGIAEFPQIAGQPPDNAGPRAEIPFPVNGIPQPGDLPNDGNP